VLIEVRRTSGGCIVTIFLSYLVLSAVLLLSACQSTQHSSVFQLVDATSSRISAADIDFSWLEGIESVDIDNFRQIVLLSNSDNTAYLHIKPQLENNRQNIHLYVRMVDSQNHYEEYIYPIPENQRAEFVSWSPNAKFFAAKFADTDTDSCIDFSEVRIYSVSEQLKSYHAFAPPDIQQCLVSAWSHDGNQIAVAFSLSQVHIIDTSGTSQLEINLPPPVMRAVVSHMIWNGNTLAVVRSLENGQEELHLVDTTQADVTIKSYTIESAHQDERSALIALSQTGNNGLWLSTRSQRSEIYDIRINQNNSLRASGYQKQILHTLDKKVTWDKLQTNNHDVDTWWIVAPDMTVGAIELGNETIVIFDLVELRYSIIKDKLLVKYDSEKMGFVVRSGSEFELVKIE
jgi:hypothetical protein